jgi:N6-adenosine-specific RNA methylase IME4
MTDPFAGLPRGHFGVVLADPPWKFKVWAEDTGRDRSPDVHYDTMEMPEIAALPVEELVADDAVLFLWTAWPYLKHAFEIIDAWGFEYKTAAFDWMKADARQIDLFRDDMTATMGLGYWTRANSEPCLLATRGKPQRLSAGVRQGIIEPRREHSRKPDCVHERIERLVDGAYLELFARQRRPGWTAWGLEVDKFTEVA